MNSCDLGNIKKFFLGANTPKGFISYFNQLKEYRNNWDRYLIKGGPGTGKSSLMKKIVYALQDKSEDMELIYCSSDSQSLDGVIFNDLKISIVDATPPHVLEPNYPGAFENTISICDCWNSDILNVNKDEIVNIFKENAFYQNQAMLFLSSAYGLLKSTYSIIGEYINKEKILKYTNEVVSKEIISTEIKEQGIEQKRFLSVVGVGEVIFFEDSIYKMADKIYVIDDAYGQVSDIILGYIREKLIKMNVNIVTCYCSMFAAEKIEHIIIPSLKIAFTTANEYHKCRDNIYKTIYAKNFLYVVNSFLKDEIKFNKNIVAKLINRASMAVYNAKCVHDELEDFYRNSVNFDMVDRKTDEIIDKIQNRI